MLGVKQKKKGPQNFSIAELAIELCTQGRPTFWIFEGITKSIRSREISWL